MGSNKMKIVDYKEFVRSPSGTVFCPYEPCIFHSPLQIKTDTGWQSGTRYLFNGTISLEPSFSDPENLAFGVGRYEANFPVSDTSSVDFDENGLFAILEKNEIQELINILQSALNEN